MSGTAAKFRKAYFIPIPGPSDGEIRVHKQSVRETVHQLVEAFEVGIVIGAIVKILRTSIARFRTQLPFDGYVLLLIQVQRDKKECVILSGLAQAFATVVAAVEAAKRRVPGLHQVSALGARYSLAVVMWRASV